jgi:hypothetical protein
MTLAELAQTLRGQIAGSAKAIILDADILAEPEVDRIRAAFLLDAGQLLTLRGLTAQDVPDPAAGTLRIAAGTASWLGAAAVTPVLEFALDPGGAVQVVIDVPMPAGWQFKDTFPDLDFFPFDKAAATDPCFVYASTAQAEHHPWPGKPGESIALAAGLSFAGWVAFDVFDGAAALLSDLGLNTAFRFCGPMAPQAGAAYPVTALAGGPGSGGSLTITSGLSIGIPRLAVTITPPQNAIQSIDLTFLAETAKLAFSARLVPDTTALFFHAGPKPGCTFTALDLASLPGAANFADYIPPELRDAFADCELRAFSISLAADRGVGHLGLAIGTPERAILKLIPGVIELSAITLEIDSSDPFGSSASSTAAVTASATIPVQALPDPFRFRLALDNADTDHRWEIRSVRGSYDAAVPLGSLISSLAGGADLPAGLDTVVLSGIAAELTNTAGVYGYTLRSRADAALAVLDTAITATLGLAAGYQGGGYDVDLTGAFMVGEQSFRLSLALGRAGQAPPSAVLKASWAAPGTNTLELADLATAFGISAEDVPSVPADLDLGLDSAALTYVFSRKALAIALHSVNYGNAAFAAVVKPDGDGGAKTQFFFGLATGRRIDLTALPLVGDALAKVASVSIQDISAEVASAAFSAADLAPISDLIQPVYPRPLTEGIAAGAGLALTLDLAGRSIPFKTATPGPPPASNAHLQGAPLAAASLAATPAPGGTWFDVQKTFGPVSIQKIGVRYDGGKLWVLMDTALGVGGLTIGLHGLGIGSSLKTFDPGFTIAGIDVTLSEGPVEASGGLVGSFSPVNLEGEIVLKVPSFSLAALAGFAVGSDGQPSFFLYATLLDPPPGGPAFFFVTGLAAGIGLNRKLIIPAVDGVATFPFVAWAMGQGAPDAGDKADQVLTDLMQSGIVAPQVGAYWLAAGVHFTSFEIVDSFMLLTAALGPRFEVDLLGLSRLTLPPKAPPGDEVVLAELALKASLSPEDGLISVTGQLTPNSFVLSRSCHLTGGFAYYAWFSGPHEGEFVLTIGGYHPRFTPPNYYPVVPRLTLNWQVSDQLSVTGDEYFALTSTAVMAGGGLNAVWDGGPVSAWFSVEADFLMIYKPFHYYLSADCELGASFTIDLLLTSITVTIHIGVGIEIWGPDFAGVCSVDLSIISFTISFGGGDPQQHTALTWKEFVDQLLPRQPAQPSPRLQRPRALGRRRALVAAAPADGSAAAPAVLQITVTQGLRKTLSDTSETTLNYVVDGQHCIIEVTGLIPSKEPSFPTGQDPDSKLPLVPIDMPDDLQPKDDSGDVIPPAQDFGIGPVDVADGAFTSTLAIQIASEEAVKFHAVRILRNIPKSFWKKADFPDGKAPDVNPVQDTTIGNALVGFRLVPFADRPDYTRQIDAGHFRFTTDEEHIQHFRWSAGVVPSGGSFAGATVEQTITGTNAVRDPILAAIREAGFPVAATVDPGDLGKPTTYLHDAPVMALLGEATGATT